MPMGITLLAWGNCVDNVFGLLGLAKVWGGEQEAS